LADGAEDCVLRRLKVARPIVKWAGGKTGLLNELLPRVGAKVRTYAEPFAGGAALFFKLASADKAFARAILCDRNPELVACYTAVRDHVDQVLAALENYHYDKDLYYEVRDQDPEQLSDVDRAARLLFLNHTCFNGLWRVNASGKFNVPFGRYKNPRIKDESGLRAASTALARAKIMKGDFTLATKSLGPGDFAYFDPPYVPLSRTAAFTAYASGGFDADDQDRLVQEMFRLRDKGVRVMLSNADSEETRELYKDFACYVVQARRSINANTKRRGGIGELIVVSWEKPGLRVANVA
jgi:DNA adenine methylase